MPAKVYVLPLWDFNTSIKMGYEQKYGKVQAISTISKATDWRNQLSPFILGPCKLYKNYRCMNVENGWQFSKVYIEHMKDDKVSSDYWKWAKQGWADKKAHRYPMGKGRKPQFSLWEGERLDYVNARKTIYGPLYADAVQKTEAYGKLSRLMRKLDVLILLDYDAYNHHYLKMSLTDVLNNPAKKMGHAFVLAMLLTNDPALDQFKRSN